MLPVIERLLVLQLRDKELADLEADQKRIPQEKELAKMRLQSSESAVAQAKKAVQENEMAIKTLELDGETRKNTIGRLKTQQFETRKNEEFRAIGVEIEKYQAEIDDLETKELELMEAGDTLRDVLNEANDKLAKAKESVEEEISLLSRREETNNERLAELKEQRARAAAAVEDQEALELYERLLTSRGTNSIVSLAASGQCSGCHVKVTPSTLLRVNADKELVQCENCARILFPG
ncbi:MAG: C4-type zinc ribbon domain-containing protein [Verrucomicrobiota bacterium JB023]|nr:C4-type zinc ribbon domain-containing protein [Verrucomicrobiota bacterium JB023]